MDTKGMVSAICIKWPTKEILLVLNTDSEKPLGFWGLPGGKMKNGEMPETPEEGACRELFQETNQEWKATKHIIEISKIGSDGGYTHYFIAIKITSEGERELKNHEDAAAIPKWIPLQEIISGRVKMFRGHVKGLIMLLEKMAEKSGEGKLDRHGIPILSEGPSLVVELLAELKKVFNPNGQHVRPLRP